MPISETLLSRIMSGQGGVRPFAAAKAGVNERRGRQLAAAQEQRAAAQAAQQAESSRLLNVLRQQSVDQNQGLQGLAGLLINQEGQLNPEAAALVAGVHPQLGIKIAGDTANRATQAASTKFSQDATTRQLDQGDRRIDVAAGNAAAQRDAAAATRDAATKQRTTSTEAGLRKELSTLSKDFVKVRDAFSRIKASAQDPDAPGDLALIFNYMKVLDPGSTVREGEFANAQNAAGVPEQVSNLFNRVLSGERLGIEQRKEFVARARLLFEAQERQHNAIKKQFSELAERAGGSPQNVAIDRSLVEEPQAGEVSDGTMDPEPGKIYTNKQTGEKIILQGDQWVPAP